jgi:protein TonB
MLAHALGAWILLGELEASVPGGSEPAIMIDLAPLPVEPMVEPVAVLTEPEAREQPPDVPEPEEPDLPLPPEPELPVLEETRAEPANEALFEVPDMPPVPNAAAQLTTPRPPVGQPPERRRENKPRPAPREPRKAPPKPAQAPPRPTATSTGAAAPISPPGPMFAVAPATWRGALLAQLNRAKRYPQAAQARREEGVARLSFTINRAGQVVSYRLVGSSGSPLLDAEVLAMIQRASPLPAPPPDVPGALVDLVVPVRFDLN